MDLEIAGVSVLVAFAAGLLSCLSPCVLPLVPAYLGYLTGVSLEAGPARTVTVQQAAAGGTGGGTATLAVPRSTTAPSPFLHSVSFVSGFSVVFVLVFGVSAGLLGYLLQDSRDVILKISGTLLIVMGLHLSGVITIPLLAQERRPHVEGTRVGYARSFAVGSAFSAGWSPCIGPTLGAILTLAVAGGSVAEAIVLLLVYSAGLSVPFLAMGAAYSSVKPLYERIKPYSGVINYVSGGMLIVIGILVFTDSLVDMNGLFGFWFLGDISAKT
jgi:cytochrome c-type biogenesis protein